jgi:type IV secretion system protein VirB10
MRGAKRITAVALLSLLAGSLHLAVAASTERKVRLAEGTKIVFSLNDRLSTKTSRAGDEFSGVVSRSVRIGEDIVIPEGSAVHGKVTRVERPGRVKGRAQLELRFEAIELPDGTELPISASLTELDEKEKEKVTEEGGVEGEGSKKRDAATIGAGAGIGAAIGAITGGGKGAATGAAIGAGAGTGVVLATRGKDLELKRGTELAIQLDRALTVSVK